MTGASSDHSGIILTWKPKSPHFIRKQMELFLNVSVLHKGNCVICSVEAFCLTLITNLTTTNSVMLYNASVIKEKKNYKYTHNLHLPCWISVHRSDING